MTPVVDTSEAAPGAVSSSPGGGRVRRAAVVGLGSALVVGLVLTVVDWGWPAGFVALGLVVLAPTARSFDRRLALNLALAVGWLPLAAHLPPALGPQTASTVAVAIATGAAAAAVVLGRPLRPEVRRRDLGVALAGVLAAVVAGPLRSPGDPARALAMLSTGIDNAFHFSLFLERRLAVAGSALAAQADTSGFDSYPKGFHDLLTVVAQLGYGEPGSPTTELQRYAGLEWVLFVVVALMTTAALLQALPDHTPATVIGSGLVVLWSLVLGVPGALNLLQGHLSFLLAAAAILTGTLLSVTGRRGPVVTVVAALGAVVAATAWTLLLPFAAVMAAHPLISLWRRMRRPLRIALAALVGVVGVAGAAVVLPLVGANALADLVRDGTIPRVNLVVLVVLAAGPLALHLWLRRRTPSAVPLVPVLPVLAAGALQLVLLGLYMEVVAGRLTYYFWKLGLATLIVSVPLAVLLVGQALGGGATTPPSTRRGRPAAVLVSLVAMVGVGATLSQFTAPSAAWAAILPSQLAARPGNGQAGDVATVLALAAAATPAEAERTTLVASREDDMHAGHASGWFHALTLSTSGRAMSMNDLLYDLGDDRGDTALAVQVVRQALEQPDAKVLVTDPRVLAEVRATASPADAARVALVEPAAR